MKKVMQKKGASQGTVKDVVEARYQIALDVDERLHNIIRKAAFDKGMSKASYVRQVLQNYKHG